MSKWRILVVDDEQEIRDVIAEFLRALGHSVSVTASGREAMDRISEIADGFELALVDWNMPGIAGRDVIRDIARRSPDTRVLITTGYQPGSIGRGKLEGLRADVLHKPFSLTDLRSSIAQLMSDPAEN